MISVSTNTATALNKSSSVSMTNGCHIEYNMNDLITGASVTAPEGVITATLTAPASQGGYTYKPFEKLFPITSILDPRRPKVAGVQYMILGDPSLATNFSATGVGSAGSYASSKEFTKRIYFSSIKTAYKYWVTPKASGLLLSNCVLSLTYPAAKTAAANKIVIKFETSHSKPTSWTVNLVNLAAAESLIYTGTTCPDSGVVNLYYNGSSWSTTEPATVPEGVNLSGLKLQVNSIDVSNGYLGIIEISARLVKDVTDSIESFDISQNSSDSIDGLVPVGDVTANSLSMNINSYDRSYEDYDKVNAFNKSKLNMYKNIMIKPFVKIESEKVNLGVFYLDSYEVSEFGDVSINALDGARELQYIKPPDIVTKNMSSVAIIRRMLDAVGFTNYKFNLVATDSSIVTPFYWFTDPQKTVWQHIQDLCRDTQMVAVFDNNDVLQFYPRGYIFDKAKSPALSFRYNNTSDGKLANISAISIENVPSVKAIKVFYSPQITSNYDSNGDLPYTSPLSELGAAALEKTLDVPPTSANADLGVITLSPIQIAGSSSKLYSYTGYLVVEKEIIEYDAIKYIYEPVIAIPGQPTVEKWITSDSDIQATQALSKPNTFKATGQYRIKKRNAFDLVKDNDDLVHRVDPESLKTGWAGSKWNSKTGNFTGPNQSIFTLQEKPIKGSSGEDLANPNNLFYPIPRSMMTIFAPVVEFEDYVENGIPLKRPINNKDYSIVTINGKYSQANSSIVDNFIIGTSMYFPLITNPNNNESTGEQRTISGIAFSLSADNKSGYFLSIGTSQNVNSDKNYRDINFYKINNGIPVKISDEQKEGDSSIVTGIKGGKMYKIDIRANYSTPTVAAGQPTPGKVLTLRVSIDNKSFLVVDQSPLTTITQKVGLISLQGVSSFDYIYTAPLTIEEFTSNESFDPYKGFLGGDSSIVKTFGEFIFNKKSQQTNSLWIKEFGPVARELRRIQSRFQYPSFPLYPRLVNNPNVTIAGASLDSFTMDVYVLNNTSSFTYLANEDEIDFAIVGNKIVPSDSFEYIDPTISEADKQEIIGFESTWIQRESEAKALSEWMRDQWSKQQKVISVETFLNPIIQIGDVVELSYPANGLYSSEDTSIPAGYAANKFVVLSINSTYDKDSPPTTSLACRSVYI